MTSTRRELPVPTDSVDRLWDFFEDRDPMNAADWVRAITAPVLAVALSDIATSLELDGHGEASRRLRERAREYGGVE